MSRCRCCDLQLTNNDSYSWNKLAQQEEDMCSVCRYLVYNSYTEYEYIGGRYPVDGVSSGNTTKDY